MTDNYFLEKDAKYWCLKSAFNYEEKKDPSIPSRHILRTLKDKLTEAGKEGNKAQAAEAKRLLKEWQHVKSLIQKGDKKSQQIIYNNRSQGGILIAQPSGPVTIMHQPSADSVLSPSKRSIEQADLTSEAGSWNSEESKRRKCLRVFLISQYAPTDFDEAGDETRKVAKHQVL
ncbi:hypothetical protein EC973_001877 [Apophysomyces ossiformis]|uniref:Uncharacterized protein n=1 Tax=Apophysomyces ossiformis TaxID=679940 RepID=A0A8H7EP01_9FUNG|nr:hypothetical protein EC973_001877 [Apophysomyces ossiformis]